MVFSVHTYAYIPIPRLVLRYTSNPFLPISCSLRDVYKKRYLYQSEYSNFLKASLECFANFYLGIFLHFPVTNGNAQLPRYVSEDFP